MVHRGSSSSFIVIENFAGVMTDRVGKSARWSPERAHDDDEVAAVPNFGKPDW
jgi:hypothetical protein